MRRLFLSFIATFSCLSANAGFVSASFGTLGLDQQTTFMRHQADARATGEEQSLQGVLIPFSGELSAMSAPLGDWANAYSSAAYNFSAGELRADVSRLDSAGPSFAGVNGAWLFSVTEQAHVVATGFLNVLSVGHSSVNALRVTMFDLSAGVLLFDSWQEDQSLNEILAVGELGGSTRNTFTGSLDNMLDPGHVYRLTYSMGVSNIDSSAASGMLALSIRDLPEPASIWLVALGLAFTYAARAKGRRESTQ